MEMGPMIDAQQAELRPRSPEYYDQKLNPDKTLPKVSLQQQPNNARGTFIPTTFTVSSDADEQIGALTVNISRPPNKEPHAELNTIEVNENLRGKGYGKATYVELLKSLGDTRLRSGFQLSRGSAPIWDWLVEKGVARVVDEGKVDEDKEYAGFSSKAYEII